ncbi:MAG: hypothetical protein ACPG9P_05765 [Candidatus Pseudothioglobus sp.]
MHQNDKIACPEHPRTNSSGGGLGAMINVSMDQKVLKNTLRHVYFRACFWYLDVFLPQNDQNALLWNSNS